MSRETVDLATVIDETNGGRETADFPVGLEPLYYGSEGSYQGIPERWAVVRKDTGQTLAVVSTRYALVPHQKILNAVEKAINPLKVGPVRCGVYVDRQGARMRAIFKFPKLTQPVSQEDKICPCLKIQKTYDGSSRIGIHIGAFRFVCTNLAVGGAGAFAGGFMSVHKGEIPLDEISDQIMAYLDGFKQIVALNRRWSGQSPEEGALAKALDGVPVQHKTRIIEACPHYKPTIYKAYNVATHYATHRTYSYRIAFDLLQRINQGFPEIFTTSRN